ncbi:LysR family transcriptional regulator [Actinobacillus succinogenes]|uniref:Transcriptional regulator, LysR family n=1 Tax=Actinobacillus succinogenes (strain ATCC 55618 / DSM 22257 / CCUG 43843 / 130Z) TaxID=339671 RepID=A6VNY1_ACTSZ|nr:LysR family transcriptional regulator [Actinobacillus succinogenes]ABR74678.1 transcriptional regulator, LysR family [Actinobacillus succinogenes 130Z]PHI40900.1 LysR family transcriptional regulator [Actinobacillus succinogenes]
MINKISLNALKFFYRVAKCNSVTQAAEQLFVSQSAVSKQLKNLEELLKTALFERVGKTLQLTEQGKQLYACCEEIFPKLNHCLHDIAGSTSANKPLVVSCEPTICMKWLIPRLQTFNALGHGFDVVVLAGGGQVDFAYKHIDLAIRRNDFIFDNRFFTEKLGDEYIIAIDHPHHQTQKLLLSTSRPNFPEQLHQYQWQNDKFLAYPRQYFEHFYLCIEAVMAGLGMTIASFFMVEKELDYRFVKAVSQPVHDGSAYYLLSDSPFTHDPRKTVFKQWLQAEFRKTCEKAANKT